MPVMGGVTPLPPGSSQTHLVRAGVCARDGSLLFLCGDLLGQKVVGSDDDVVCGEAAEVEHSANRKQSLRG